MPSKISMLWSTDDRKWRPPLFPVLYLKSCRITFVVAESFQVYQKWGITGRFPKFYTSAEGYFTPALAASRNVTKWPSDLKSQTWCPTPRDRFPSPCYLLPGAAAEQSAATPRGEQAETPRGVGRHGGMQIRTPPLYSLLQVLWKGP